MAVSGIGVILSGLALAGSNPILPPFKYSSNSAVYQIPYVNASDLANPNFKVSSFDEGRAAKIIEDQMLGVSNVQYINTANYVTFDGVFYDKSNQPANNCIVSVSGIECFINNIYIGGTDREFAWSGLSQVGTNYLWLSLVEQSKETINYRSSREFRDFDTRATTTNNPPTQESILVATFISGTGIDGGPSGKSKLTHARDHVFDNQNPHGVILSQNGILTSGIDILGITNWSGANVDFRYTNVKYLNELTQYVSMVTSGVEGNIYSGNLTYSFFDNFQNLEADPANVGYLYASSNESVVNYVFYSEAFDNAAWGQQFVTVTANAIANPISGEVTADLITETAVNNVHAIYQNSTTATTPRLTIGASYTYSVYAKMNGRRYLDLFLSNNTSLAVQKFDLQSGVMLSPSGSAGTGAITDVGNGWYRCSVTGTAATNAQAILGIYPNSSSSAFSTPYVGDGASGVYLYGAQLVASTSLTGYVPNFGGSYPISAKVAMSISGSLFRGTVSVISGSTVDGLDLSTLSNCVSRTAISGNLFTHTHALISSTTKALTISPKYPNSVTYPALAVGKGSNKRWEYNNDLGQFKGTLRHKSSPNSDTDNLYIRMWMPTCYNKLDSVEVESFVQSGSTPIGLLIRDAVGTQIVPYMGNSIGTSGLTVTTVSGIPQAGFGQNRPIDLEFTFRSISGTSQYLGDIIFNFKSARG